VVAIDCPYGPRDIITQGENGFLVPLGSEKVMVDTLLTLSDNGELRNSMAERSVERASFFSIKKMVDGYEDFFDKICVI
jgi:glycosyltransferase involved in cell wall biosynthesis